MDRLEGVVRKGGISKARSDAIRVVLSRSFTRAICFFGGLFFLRLPVFSTPVFDRANIGPRNNIQPVVVPAPSFSASLASFIPFVIDIVSRGKCDIVEQMKKLLPPFSSPVCSNNPNAFLLKKIMIISRILPDYIHGINIMGDGILKFPTIGRDYINRR